ncbi:hypothetical protein Pint_05255 [Pistacia integerrima]|uniref:Uncharacterized protein n=1 Tax=Pistacia integerrima TaxID=434235 RepID=A0ACC0Z7N6_9ROSI|nr:hypothetical protein Pint_05255 [Pistacia integerrima]
MTLSLYVAASFSPSPKFSKFPPPPSSSSSSSCFRVVCRGGYHAPYATSELKLALHDALDSTGIDTTYARGFRRTNVRNQIDPRALYLHSILRNLKSAFWPFQHDFLRSLFSRTAHAANCIEQLNSEDSDLQLASAKAAKHGLEHGVWTSVRFGDMRCALAGM